MHAMQATLKSNGDILFVYEMIPAAGLAGALESNVTEQHFIAGISDAFLMGGTLHEYSRVDVQLRSVMSSTVVKFKWVFVLDAYNTYKVVRKFACTI